MGNGVISRLNVLDTDEMLMRKMIEINAVKSHLQ
jgi:hypothetical protein